MAFVMRPRPSKNDRRRLSGGCKKHPKHRQSPGVCSICLSERLSKLSTGPSSSSSKSIIIEPGSSNYSSSCSSVSSYISSASSCLTPSDHCFDVTRFEFRKSRSIAAAAKTKKKKEKPVSESRTDGFFARLIGRSSGMKRAKNSFVRSRSLGINGKMGTD